MPLVLIGVLMLVAKWAEFGPVADWSWWVVLAPFPMAVAWWSFADSSGWTKRQAMRKMDERKAKRREEAMAALGLDPLKDRQIRQQRAQAQRDAARRQGTADKPDHRRDRAG